MNEKRKFDITGMNCAACQAKVEKAVRKLEAVDECNVNLLMNSMTVEGEASDAIIIKAVTSAGYGARRAENVTSSVTRSNRASSRANNRNPDSDNSQDSDNSYAERILIRNRLIASIFFLAALMYVSMGHMMLDFPLPPKLANDHVAMGLIQLLLAGIVMIINQRFFISGFKGLMHGAPNMDTLVALGSFASFAYSICILFAMSFARQAGKDELVMKYMDEFYFESAAMILTLITVGKLLEAKAKGKTVDALKSLSRLTPKTATILVDGVEKLVPIKEVRIGDTFTVRAGEAIPVDGVIIEGTGAVNESALTGESLPVDKSAGDRVFCVTINQNGFLKCEATSTSTDTTLSRIIGLVGDAAASKAPIAKAADVVSGVFVPVVLAISMITIIVWMLLGQSFGYALARGISVLVISCPCALGLATPVAIMVGSGVGAKLGILFKNATMLEQTGKAKVVVFDKTGTITKGVPVVTDVIMAGDISKQELLAYALTVEQFSEHPLSRAVVDYCEKNKVKALDNAKAFEALAGRGARITIGEIDVFAASYSFTESKCAINDSIRASYEKLADEGKTPLFFIKETNIASGNDISNNIQILGIIAVSDVIKNDARPAIARLKEMGIRVVMLTGDNERTAKAIARQAGVDEVIAGVLPEGKDEAIIKLKENSKVIMVGDGINDALALTRADIGMAINAGADIAIDAAGVVLVKNSLLDVVNAIRLSKQTLKNIYENLFWAFIYNVIGITLAAGVWIKLLGLELSPMFGAAAMSLSSFCVVTNALRINRYRPVKELNAETTNKEIHVVDMNKEKEIMTKTVTIEGMMCPHCEANVKKTLEAFEQVVSATADHTAKTAVVELSADLNNDTIKAAIEDKGYTVIDIK